MGDNLAPDYGGPCMPQGVCAGSRCVGALGEPGKALSRGVILSDFCVGEFPLVAAGML